MDPENFWSVMSAAGSHSVGSRHGEAGVTDKIIITPTQPLKKGDTLVITEGSAYGTYLVAQTSYSTLPKTNRAMRRAEASRKRRQS